jgi:hypothetical protein
LRSFLSEEKGAVALIFALLLVVLLGFAAIAVDISAVYVERRHAQTAADVGVLSGAQFAGLDTTDTAEEARLAVIDEVERITAENLDATDWAACVDASRPAEFNTVAGETGCISFTFGLTKIRVRVPDQSFDTYFAGVIGVDTLSTSAAAEVETIDFRNGDILPFGIPSTDADATVGCPSDHPNGLYPCDGPTSGNFNRLQVRQWGTSPPPDNDCTHSNGMFEDNIAMGVDHPLGIFPDNPGRDKDMCDDPNVANPPGIVESNTGVAQSTLAPGFITGNTGGNGFDGRLTDTPYDKVDIMGFPVDDKPLWEFITNWPGGTALAGVPDSCQGTSFSSGMNEDWDEDLYVSLGLDPVLDDPDYDASVPNSHLEERTSFEHMARCLREYKLGTWDEGAGYIGPGDPGNYAGAGYDGNAGSGVLFGKADNAASNTDRGVYDLQLSPRWGWSPIGTFTTGVADFPITGYMPIFVNTLVSECNATTCNWVWSAGENPAVGIPGGNKIASVLSFQLPDSTLPQKVIDFGPNAEYTAEYTLTK